MTMLCEIENAPDARINRYENENGRQNVADKAEEVGAVSLDPR
jgi:hypothetical protein